MAKFIPDAVTHWFLVTGLSAATLKMALVDGSCALDEDDTFLSAATLGEPSITGYTGGHGGAGRLTLASKTFTIDDANNQTEFTAATFSWALGVGATIQAGILHIAGTTGDTDARFLGRYEVGGATGVVTNGATFTFNWGAEGVLVLERKAGS